MHEQGRETEQRAKSREQRAKRSGQRAKRSELRGTSVTDVIAVQQVLAHVLPAVAIRRPGGDNRCFTVF
jgi:hypothetical protein